MNTLRKLTLFSLFLAVVLNATEIPAPLTPYQMIDISSGHGIASGEVGTGHQVYGFNGIAGHILDLQVLVTEVRPGTVYTDDDSMLWLFDSTGALLDSNDDYGDLQSRIPSFYVPATGLYFAGVTTCCTSDPLYGAGGALVGWEDAGESNIKFDLDITDTSVPEPSSFALIGLGAITLGLVGRFRK